MEELNLPVNQIQFNTVLAIDTTPTVQASRGLTPEVF